MSFISDNFFGGAEKKAARARASGLNEGIDTQREFGRTLDEFQPSINRGDAAARRESDFLGLNGRNAEQGAINSFIESPGQAFLRERGERSLLRNSAAIGGLGGGNVRTALQEQGIGIAAQQLGDRQNRLSDVARRGLGALTDRTSFRSGVASNVANLQGGVGNANGQALEARASGIRGGLARVAGAFTGSGKIGGSLGKLF